MRGRATLRFELDGPGATPATVDSLLMLRLAQTAFHLLTKVAEVGSMSLTLSGLDVRDKCVAITVRPSDRDTARIAVDRVVRMVAGHDAVPKGLVGTVEALRKELRGLPDSVSARMQAVGRAKRLTAPPLPVADLPWETTELRVTPIRVGGMDPGVQLSSVSEPAPFTLDVTQDGARKLGASLYREVDVTVEISRGVDGRIEKGRVTEIVPLEDAEPIAAWREWFAKNAPEWDSVDDVRGELGRRLDD